MLPLVFASFTWGLSEIMCDECIDDGESGHGGADGRYYPMYTVRACSRAVFGYLGAAPEKVPVDIEPAATASERTMAERAGKMSGEQCTAIAGLVLFPCTVVLHALIPPEHAAFGAGTGAAPHKYGPPVLWLAALGGVTQGLAALALYKAYETAPSTLIVPLTQLTAVMTLITSTLTALAAPFFPELLGMMSHSMIHPKDLLAYVVVLVGGLYPVTKGNISQFFDRGFWLQKFVVVVLVNDFLLALAYEIISICTSGENGMHPDMYVVITGYANTMLYLGVFVLVPKFRLEFKMLRDVEAYYLLLGVGAEVTFRCGVHHGLACYCRYRLCVPIGSHSRQ